MKQLKAIKSVHMSSPHVDFLLISKGYIFNEDGSKVFTKLYGNAVNGWKRLVIFQKYNFSINGNRMMETGAHLKDGKVSTTIEIEVPCIYYTTEDITMAILETIGFKF